MGPAERQLSDPDFHTDAGWAEWFNQRLILVIEWNEWGVNRSQLANQIQDLTTALKNAGITHILHPRCHMGLWHREDPLFSFPICCPSTNIVTCLLATLPQFLSNPFWHNSLCFFLRFYCCCLSLLWNSPSFQQLRVRTTSSCSS